MTRRLSMHPRDRFAKYTIPEPNSGCLLWVGTYRVNGYGAFSLNSKLEVASRAAWMLANGPIPNGLFVCHRCDTPECVSIDHLFLGTAADNNADRSRKGRSRPAGPQFRKTHCKHGHLFDDANTYRPVPSRDWRVCRTCQRRWAAEKYARNKAIRVRVVEKAA